MHRYRLFALPAFATFASLLTGCGSVPTVGTKDNLLPAGEVPADQIRWPARYQPRDATFFISNEILVNASPQTVWDVLINVESWPEWYAGASNLNLQSSTPGRLAQDAVLSWRIMDLNFVSTVMEFAPPYRLSWESRKSTIQGYHAWLLIPTDDGTRIVTDESQFGLLAWLQGIFVPKKLSRLHDESLAAIKQRAEAIESSRH